MKHFKVGIYTDNNFDDTKEYIIEAETEDGIYSKLAIDDLENLAYVEEVRS